MIKKIILFYRVTSCVQHNFVAYVYIIYNVYMLLQKFIVEPIIIRFVYNTDIMR